MEKNHTKSIVNIVTLNSENFLEEKSYQKIENDAYWQNNLSNQEYNITRLKHTERAFSSIDHNTASLGLYYCINRKALLFIEENRKEKPTIDSKKTEINNFLNQNNNEKSENKILSLKVTKKIQINIWSKLKKRLFF